MRTLVLLTVLGLPLSRMALADEQLLEQFDGHNSLTTSDFTVPNGWEIRWHSKQNLSVGVILLDNTVVAGGSGMNSGSLYLAKGGSFRLKVKGLDSVPWDVTVVTMGPVPLTAEAKSEIKPFYVPTPGPSESAETNAAPTDGNSTNTPGASTPDTNTATESPAPPPLPPVPTSLTDSQTKAIVEIKGDRATGSGFLVKTATGPVVMTNLHLLANNPRLTITTEAGSEVQILGLQGAPDRDLAMISIQDSAYTYLEMATDLSAAARPGDVVLTEEKDTDPDDTPATVLTVRQDRIELDHFHNHGESGGPLVDAKSEKVIAVVTAHPQVSITTDLEKTPFATRDAAATSVLAYVALRFDAIAWEKYDLKRFANETAFLDEFHQHSRCLDSYLNGRANDFRPMAKLYMTDEKIKSANDGFIQDSAGGDSSQRTDALRALLFELGIEASTNLDQIQQPSNFYTYDQQRARDENAYRTALKAQLDFYGNNVNRFSSVARRNN